MDEASFWVSTEKEGSWQKAEHHTSLNPPVWCSWGIYSTPPPLLFMFLHLHLPENPSLYACSFFTGSGNTVATWCKELTHWKRPCCWERLKARKEGEDKTEDEMVGWHHWLNGYELEQTPSDSEGEKPGVLQFMGAAKSWTWLSNWTTTILTSIVLGSNTLLHL